jgi:hypothetical protein
VSATDCAARSAPDASKESDQKIVVPHDREAAHQKGNQRLLAVVGTIRPCCWTIAIECDERARTRSARHTETDLPTWAEE